LVLAAVIVATGCVYEASPPQEEIDPSFEVDWIDVPSVTEAGREESFVVSGNSDGIPRGGSVRSSLIVSESPRERPSPENASLDCFPHVDLWASGATAEVPAKCSFNEPGTMYLRGYMERKWDGLENDGDWIRAWSEPTRVIVLPRIDIKSDGPQHYHPNETVEIEVVLSTSEQTEGRIQIAFAPPGDGERGDIDTFEGRCEAEPFQGDTRTTIECDWSDGGNREWAPFVEIDTDEGEYRRTGRVQDSWEEFR
jgi:hypothetical protein